MIGKTRAMLKRSLRLDSYAIVLERLWLLKRQRCSSPQLFILGLPRSGTTLIYQYIVHRLNVAYFTHGVGAHPRVPCVVTWYQHNRYGQYRSDFESKYGKVEGPVSPREAGTFWGRFFDLNNYVDFEDLRQKDISVLQKTVACIQNIFGGKPFVNKNVKHLQRINAIAEIFPNSIFLVVERQLQDVALSVLRARRGSPCDSSQWFSVRPINYDAIKNLSIPEQVANQCKSVTEKMEQDLSLLPNERVIRIKYEDFCREPEALIKNVGAALCALKTDNPSRDFFTISRNSPQSAEENKLLKLLAVF